MWLKYTVLYSDFQPCVNNYATINLNIVPTGSFLQNIKVCANDNFIGGSVSGCSVTASFQSALYDVSHTLDAFNHPYSSPSPPIPQSRDVLINDVTSQTIKVKCQLTGDIINNLSAGAVDIYFQLNEVTYPYKLDLIFKQPAFVFAFEQITANAISRAVLLKRASDSAYKYFDYINRFMPNADIITWLGGSNAHMAGWYNQLNAAQYIGNSDINSSPIYDASASLMTFDGINDFIKYSHYQSYGDFTFFFKSTPDVNQCIGYDASNWSGFSSGSSQSYFRYNYNEQAFTANHVGLASVVFMRNNGYVSAWIDAVSASEGEVGSLSGTLYWNTIGSRYLSNYFNGDFSLLVIYDGPLAESEIKILNSI